MGQLAQKWRAKYPGAYDDMDDGALEAKVLAKFPQYKDLAGAPPAPASPSFSVPPLDIAGSAGYELPETSIGRALLEPPAEPERPWYRTPVNVAKAGGAAVGGLVGEVAHGLRRGADIAIGSALRREGLFAPLQGKPLGYFANPGETPEGAPATTGAAGAGSRMVAGQTTAGQELNPIPDDWWKDKEGTLAHLAAAGSAG